MASIVLFCELLYIIPWDAPLSKKLLDFYVFDAWHEDL